MKAIDDGFHLRGGFAQEKVLTRYRFLLVCAAFAAHFLFVSAAFAQLINFNGDSRSISQDESTRDVRVVTWFKERVK